MIAIIPCAGYGTRSNELGINTPKALFEIQNQTILDIVIKKIEELNVDKIYVITNNKFHQQFLEWQQKTNKNVELLNNGTNSNEERLGAIGDLNHLINLKNISDDLIIIGGDNLFSFSLKEALEIFNENKIPLIVTIKVPLEEANRYANVETNENNEIISFEEKPEKPKTNKISTFIYFLNKDNVQLIKKYIDEGNNPDAPGFLIQHLYKKIPIHALNIEGNWFDIGSQKSYQEALKESW